MSEIEFCGIDGERLENFDIDPMMGEVIERCKVVSLIGQGSMGSVYRARHLVLERDFALKVLFGDLASNRTLVARFRREAQALSKVRHTNIISVVDFGTTDNGLTFLIMDYVQGENLTDIITREGPLSPLRAANITRQTAAGLAEAHRLGLIHRDVKPANLVLVREGDDEIVKLLDFGVVAAQDDADATKLTGQGRIVGTPTYMAPEQGRPGPVTHQADLYSLGVILYQMLAGRPPFDSNGIAEVLVMHQRDPVPLLAPARGLEKLAYWLLEKDPAVRPATGTVVVNEIDRLTAEWSSAQVSQDLEPRSAPDNGAPRPVPRSVSSGRLRVLEIDGSTASVSTVATVDEMIPLPQPPGAPGVHKNEVEVVLGSPVEDAGNVTGPVEVVIGTPLEGPLDQNISQNIAPLLPSLQVLASDLYASAPPLPDEPPMMSSSPPPLTAPTRPTSFPQPSALMMTSEIMTADIRGVPWHQRIGPTTGLLGLVLGMVALGIAYVMPPGADPAPRDPPPSIATAAVLPASITSSKSAQPPADADEDKVVDSKQAAAALPRLEKKLHAAIESCGLVEADLEVIPSTAPLAERWRLAKQEGREADAAVAAAELVDVVKSAPIGSKLLKAKLARAAAAIRVEKKLRASERNALLARHKDLAGQVKANLKDDRAKELAAKISKLEDDVARRPKVR